MNVQENQINRGATLFNQIHAIIIGSHFDLLIPLGSVLLQELCQAGNEFLFIVADCNMQHRVTSIIVSPTVYRKKNKFSSPSEIMRYSFISAFIKM